MSKQGGGKIINIASISSSVVNLSNERPVPQLAYYVTKAGVVMLTKASAAEWGKYNIRMNYISPGYTRTLLLERYLSSHKQDLELWTKLTSLGRIADPYDIALAALFLASNASRHITGQNIVVDGGYTLY